jgi:phage terminase large subunit-like protein
LILHVPPLEENGKEWPSLGPLVCDYIEERFVFGPGDLYGKPAVLDEEKRFLIWRMYEVYPPGHERAGAGRRRFNKCAVSEPKGSAKTELMAWIAGVELAPDSPARCDGFRKDGSLIWRPVSNPYIPLCAYTEFQTEELAYGALKSILEKMKDADRYYDIGLDRIIRIGKNGKPDGKCEAVASAPGSADGARTTFQGFDETHRFIRPQHRKAYQTMMQNIPKRKLSDAWSLETTTAYQPGERSVAEATHQYAKAVDDGRLKNARLFYFHRQAGEHYNLDDEEQRRAAVIEASGPMAGWRDIDGIAAQYDDPTVERAYWIRVWLNRPMKGADRAFDPEVWKSRAKAGEIPGGRLVSLGFDGGRTDDATALIATDVMTGFQQTVKVWERPLELAPKDRWEIDTQDVNKAVAACFKRWKVVRFYADPPHWEDELANWSNTFGKDIVIRFQTQWLDKMVVAICAFRDAMHNEQLTHDGDDAYARHVGNAVKRYHEKRAEHGERVWTIYKERPDSPLKIDAAMAGILSWMARLDALRAGVEAPRPKQDYVVDWVGA